MDQPVAGLTPIVVVGENPGDWQCWPQDFLLARNTKINSTTAEATWGLWMRVCDSDPSLDPRSSHIDYKRVEKMRKSLRKQKAAVEKVAEGHVGDRVVQQMHKLGLKTRNNQDIPSFQVFCTDIVYNGQRGGGRPGLYNPV